MDFQGQSRSDDADINLTPLIDVVFLLLIFFMVSTTFEQYSQLEVDLPESGQAPDSTANPPEPVRVAIDAKGRYLVANETLASSSVAALETALQKQLGSGRRRPVHIYGDADAPHQALVRVLDAAANVRVSDVHIATRHLQDEP
jgi:biopolymer transport protein ExbD